MDLMHDFTLPDAFALDLRGRKVSCDLHRSRELETSGFLPNIVNCSEEIGLGGKAKRKLRNSLLTRAMPCREEWGR